MKKLIITLIVLFCYIAPLYYTIADDMVPLNRARQIKTDTTNFNGTLSATDTDVQKALETIDAFSYLGLTAKAADSELWDGYNFADYLNQAVKTTSSPTFLTETLTGNIINTATTSLNPVARGTVVVGAEPFNVYVQGGYAYTSNSGAGTMSIIDISNPDSPQVVGTATGLGFIRSLHVAGKYAYCLNATTNTLKIVDISNPSAPVIVGSNATFNLPSYVFVEGIYAYIVNSDLLGGDKYLQIINIADPTAPVSVSSVALQSTGATSVYVKGGYAYVVTTGKYESVNNLYPAGDTFEIYNVSNPASPTLVNTNYTNLSAGVGTHTDAGTSNTVLTDSNQSWTTNSLIGMIIHNVTDNAYGQITANDSAAHTITSTALSNSGQWDLGDAYSIEYTVNEGTHTGGTSATTLTDSSKSWTVNYFSVGSKIYNITDGTSATITANTINTITTSGITWDNLDTYVINSPLSPNPFSVMVQGNYAYISLTSLNKINIYDVSNPAIPEFISSVSTTGTSPLSVRVAGRYVIVGNYGASDCLSGGGIEVFDVIDPAAPVSVGNVVTGCPQGIFTQGKFVYDVNYGVYTLVIFELNGLETTSALIHSLEAGDLGVRGDARIGNNMWLGGGLTTGLGGIYNQGDTGVAGRTIYPFTTAQGITGVGTAILADATYIRLNPNGDYILTVTPTIADGVRGQIIYITCGNTEPNTVTLQDQDTLAGSNLQLGAATRTIGKRDILTLIFDGTDWCEQSYSDNK